MIEFAARDFEDLCRTGIVRSEIATIEDRRRRAVRRFWLLLAGSLLLGSAIGYTLLASGWPLAGTIIGLLLLALGIGVGLHPLTTAKEDLKHSALETLAQKGGMEYLPDGFDPPVFPSANRLLFGSISSFSFSDLFHGTDADGKRYAFYEGSLTRRQGKNTHTIFKGQLYAFQRQSRGEGELAIVPDASFFNFLMPRRGLARVRFDGDPAFENWFEVHATDEAAALRQVDADLRRTLVALRQSGKLFAYIGPEDVLVAIWGKDRFEPGSMFRSRPGEERVRQMFDDVCASMAVMRSLMPLMD